MKCNYDQLKMDDHHMFFCLLLADAFHVYLLNSLGCPKFIGGSLIRYDLDTTAKGTIFHVTLLSKYQPLSDL